MVNKRRGRPKGSKNKPKNVEIIVIPKTRNKPPPPKPNRAEARKKYYDKLEADIDDILAGLSDSPTKPKRVEVSKRISTKRNTKRALMERPPIRLGFYETTGKNNKSYYFHSGKRISKKQYEEGTK